MNAELTAENRPACVPPEWVFSVGDGNPTTHKDEGRVQVLVVLFRIVSVEFSRFSAVDGEEVGPRVIAP